MNEPKFNSELLIKLQTYSWYFLLLYFLFAFIVYFAGIELSVEVGFPGVLIVLVLTLLKLLLMAEQFRKIKLKRFVYIAYLLLLIIFITIIIRLYA